MPKDFHRYEHIPVRDTGLNGIGQVPAFKNTNRIHDTTA
jgi:hypothetical protein